MYKLININTNIMSYFNKLRLIHPKSIKQYFIFAFNFIPLAKFLLNKNLSTRMYVSSISNILSTKNS